MEAEVGHCIPEAVELKHGLVSTRVCIAWSHACVYDCVSTVGIGCNCCLSTLLSHIFSNVEVHVLLFCMVRCGIYTYGLHPLYKYIASVSGIARSLAGYLLYASRLCVLLCARSRDMSGMNMVLLGGHVPGQA